MVDVLAHTLLCHQKYFTNKVNKEKQKTINTSPCGTGPSRSVNYPGQHFVRTLFKVFLLKNTHETDGNFLYDLYDSFINSCLVAICSCTQTAFGCKSSRNTRTKYNIVVATVQYIIRFVRFRCTPRERKTNAISLIESNKRTDANGSQASFRKR